MTSETKNQLPTYNVLGTSGLRVFPLCLGTMGFGMSSEESKDYKMYGIGVKQPDAEKIFERYLECGGNFIDTANMFQLGESEKCIGNLIKKKGISRDSLVISTKYSLPLVNDDPNSGGNHKKSMLRSVEQSLKNLQTHYIDLLYVHFWDFTMNVEHLMRDLDQVVRSGKVLHIGVTNFPAWEVARGNTIAEFKNLTPFTAFQGLYSLTNRSLEQEILPMCRKMNISCVPWGALGQGKLTGTRLRGATEPSIQRKSVFMTEVDFAIQDEVIRVSKKVNQTAPQVALNWVLQQPGISSVVIGPRTLDQFEDCVKSLEFKLSKRHMESLDRASREAIHWIFPYSHIGNSAKTNQWLHTRNTERHFHIESSIA